MLVCPAGPGLRVPRHHLCGRAPRAGLAENDEYAARHIRRFYRFTLPAYRSKQSSRRHFSDRYIVENGRYRFDKSATVHYIFPQFLPIGLLRVARTGTQHKSAAVPVHVSEVEIIMDSGTSPSDVRYLTAAEVATIMRVSKRTVYRLIHSGKLEATFVGRSFRISEQAVNQYLRTSVMRATQT
jgi:excisionase family DNA binding protein